MPTVSVSLWRAIVNLPSQIYFSDDLALRADMTPTSSKGGVVVVRGPGTESRALIVTGNALDLEPDLGRSGLQGSLGVSWEN